MKPPSILGWSSLALLLAVLTAFLFAAPGAGAQEQREEGRPRVDVLHVEGAITPVVASYLERGLTDADERGVDVIVIRLDTPGGSVSVTDGIMKRMLASETPIVVWVGPRGAMAASAGTFITLAAHVAAMSPGTSIGAASPIGSEGQEIGETAKAKIVNTLVTQMRNLAERRGVQAQDWAEDAVRNARSSSEQEVLDLRVIDLVAADIENLLSQLDGRAVTIQDKPVALKTFGAEVRDVEMSAVESLLHTIASPNIAVILMSLGMMGLVYEFANPGFGLGGVVGGICLLLGVYAMGVLPANYAGLALFVLAFALFFADAKLGTGGLIALGGVVSMVAGGLILFDSPIYEVSQPLIWSIAISCGAFFAFAASAVMRVREKPVTTGSEALIGATGIARTALAPEGPVMVRGETWRATVEGNEHVAAGEAVEVIAVEGLRLRVRAARNDNEE